MTQDLTPTGGCAKRKATAAVRQPTHAAANSPAGQRPHADLGAERSASHWAWYPRPARWKSGHRERTTAPDPGSHRLQIPLRIPRNRSGSNRARYKRPRPLGSHGVHRPGRAPHHAHKRTSHADRANPTPRQTPRPERGLRSSDAAGGGRGTSWGGIACAAKTRKGRSTYRSVPTTPNRSGTITPNAEHR
jgi:hypothetical protein